MKQIKYCKKCHRQMGKKEPLYRDMCFDCYKEFLLEKIKNMKENEPINFDDEPKPDSFFDKIIKKLKKKK